jgi:hypothetical protein
VLLNRRDKVRGRGSPRGVRWPFNWAEGVRYGWCHVEGRMGGRSVVEMVGARPAAAPGCSGDGSDGGIARVMGTGEEIEKRGRLTSGTMTQC